MKELRRYFHNFEQEPTPPILLMALLSISAVIPALTVGLVQLFIDGFPKSLEIRSAATVAGGIAALHVVDSFLLLLASRRAEILGGRVSTRIRTDLQRRYLSLGDTAGSAGERLATLTQDVDDLRIGLDALVCAYRDTMIVAVLFVMSYSLAPSVAPLGLAVLPLAVIPAVWSGARVRARGTDARAARSHLTRVAQDQLAGAATIRAHQAEVSELKRFSDLDALDGEARARLSFERAMPTFMVRAIMTTGLGLMLWAGAFAVQTGELSGSRLLGFLVALTWTVRPLTGVALSWAQLQSGFAALERVHATLEQAPLILPPLEPVDLPEGPLSVEWRRVTVDYGSGVVLHRVTLDVEPGNIIALVGPNGSGRSTLLSLVGRQLDPDVGEVHLGGVDVRLLSSEDLSRAVVLVSAHEHVFGRTIAENLRLSSPNATDEQLRDVLTRVGALDWVEQFTGGLHTPLDELTPPLSIARRQQLSVARALLSDARVLILDGATSHFTVSDERALVEHLRASGDSRVVILVPSDLDVARLADRVVVMSKGRVVESGAHEHLIAGGNLYPKLWRERR